MPVIEEPFWDDWPGAGGKTPPKGSFALIRIDPVASVAHLEDEETSRAAAALESPQWVLGVVTANVGHFSRTPDGKLSMTMILEVIGQGPPDEKPIACVPIAPSPQMHDDRPPIQLDHDLPWPNLCVHSRYSTYLIISRIHHGSTGFDVKLTEAETLRMFECAFTDRANYDTLPPVTVEDPPASPAIGRSLSPSDSPYSSESSEEEESSEEDEDPVRAQEWRVISRKMARMLIFGELCLDPTVCPGPLGAPDDLREPVRRIRELWTAWEERVTGEFLARRPETNAWAEGVAAAQATHESASEIDSIPCSLEDDIRPEDAADDRAERARAARRANRAQRSQPANDVADGPLSGDDRLPSTTPLATGSTTSNAPTVEEAACTTYSVKPTPGLVSPDQDNGLPPLQQTGERGLDVSTASGLDAKVDRGPSTLNKFAFGGMCFFGTLKAAVGGRLTSVKRKLAVGQGPHPQC